MEECCPGSRLFYAASSHVFGTPESEWQNEETPLVPNSAYGISKAAGLQCCQLLPPAEGIFAATGILFNHESPLRKPSFLSQKFVRGALRAQHDPSLSGLSWETSRSASIGVMHRTTWTQWPAFCNWARQVTSSWLLERCTRCAISREAAFDALGLDWRRHVKTDGRLLKKISHPLRGDFSKLRAATGWAPTIGFAEMVARLVHDAAECLVRSTFHAAEMTCVLR